MDDFKRAMQAAADHGMRFLPIPGREGVVAIFCAKCGWPDSHRETVIEQYANKPYGCPRCALGAKDGLPGVKGAQPQVRADG